MKNILQNVRAKSPLVLNITNFVTVNDVANILLACGASPVMSDEIKDVIELAAISSAVNINIGTLNMRTIKSMHTACSVANKNNKVVVLDPVGVGATTLRTKTAINLIKKHSFDCIKGNMSEIKTLASILCKDDSRGDTSIELNKTKGVDVNEDDIITDKNLLQNIKLVKALALKTKSIVAATGAIDIISDGDKTYTVKNGHPLMEKVCGTGCMLSGLIASYIAANPDCKTEAVATCIAEMGIAGEKGVESLGESQGNMTLRDKIIDYFMTLSDSEVEQCMKVAEM